MPVRADKQIGIAAFLFPPPSSKQLLRISQLDQFPPSLLQLLFQIGVEERSRGLGVILESGELPGRDSSINGFHTLGSWTLGVWNRGAVFAQVNSLLRLSVHYGSEGDCRLFPMALGATHRTRRLTDPTQRRCAGDGRMQTETPPRRPLKQAG